MSTGVMQPSDLAELQAPRAYPAVSVLAPMQRRRPGNAEDPIFLRDLADEAARRVRGELGTRAGAEILERLDEAVAAVDWRSSAEGVALFVAPGESRVLELPFPVRAWVAIDQTFATRDLARGMARNARRSAPAGGWWASKLPGTQSARAGHDVGRGAERLDLHLRGMLGCSAGAWSLLGLRGLCQRSISSMSAAFSGSSITKLP